MAIVMLGLALLIPTGIAIANPHWYDIPCCALAWFILGVAAGLSLK